MSNLQPMPEPQQPSDQVRAFMLAKLQRRIRPRRMGFPGQSAEHNPHGGPPGHFPQPTQTPVAQPNIPPVVPQPHSDPRDEIVRRLRGIVTPPVQQPRPDFNAQRGIPEVPVATGPAFKPTNAGPAHARQAVLANVAQRLLSARQQLGRR